MVSSQATLMIWLKLQDNTAPYGNLSIFKDQI